MIFPGTVKIIQNWREKHLLNIALWIQHCHLCEYLNNHLLLKPLFNDSPKSLSKGITLVKAMSISLKIFTPIHGNNLFLTPPVPANVPKISCYCETEILSKVQKHLYFKGNCHIF